MLRGQSPPFFQKPLFRVETKISNSNKRYPRIKIDADDETLIVCTLAKLKYYGGNPDLIWESPVDRVINTYYFDAFSSDYETAFVEMNKQENN